VDEVVWNGGSWWGGSAAVRGNTRFMVAVAVWCIICVISINCSSY
jgi:hypothetical protein